MSDQLDTSYVYSGSMEDAKNLINVLLSATITMTSLVVSVTMVVINLSASQLGPRIIRSVLSDRKTKIFIGCFFGSITTRFVVSGLLHQLPDTADVPGLSVGFVFISCFVNLFVLLAYVHHLAHLSVADSLISKVHAELMGAVSRLKSFDASDKSNKEPGKKDLPKDFEKKSKMVHSAKYGYIQTIDYKSVKNTAEDNGLCVEMLCDAGDYIVSGERLFRAYPKNQVNPDMEKKIANAIVFGEDRTGAQDIEYSIRHLVEIGLRALSPGINDNYTASAALNKLASALAELFQKELPAHVYITEDGAVCVFGQANCFKTVIDEAFSRIRDAGASKPDILKKLIDVISALYPLARLKEQRDALQDQLEHISEHIKSLEDAQSKKTLKKVLDDLRASL